MKKIAIIVLSIATAFSGMPAWAGPSRIADPVGSAVQQQAAGGEDGFVQIGCNNFNNCPRYDYNRSSYRHDRYDRRWDRRYDGNRYYRDRDYRRHDNTGAIIGGLAAGAIIGGIIASQPRVRAGNSHVDYCYNRYRSYRASDNTYQPTNGPRRQCR